METKSGGQDRLVEMAEEAARLADTLSGLIALAFPAGTKTEPEGIFAKTLKPSGGLSELVEQLEQMADVLSGLIRAVPKAIQLGKESDSGVKS